MNSGPVITPKDGMARNAIEALKGQKILAQGDERQRGALGRRLTSASEEAWVQGWSIQSPERAQDNSKLTIGQ